MIMNELLFIHFPKSFWTVNGLILRQVSGWSMPTLSFFRRFYPYRRN